MKRHACSKIHLVIALITMLTSSPAMAEEKIISFGIVPQQAAGKLAKLWVPILQYVSEKSGITLRFATAPNIPEFERRVAAGEYDIAYMNPYHYTVFSQSPGYRAFAKQKGKLIYGIMVVRSDSGIKSVQELRDQELAFPSPAAFAASVLTRAYLTNQQIPFTPKYVSSHDSVYLGVAKQLYVAGGGIERTLGNIAPELRSQLRILWKSDGYTPHAFAAHPDLNDDVLSSVASAFISMQSNETGAAVLRSINFKHGLEAAEDRDWDDVRKLGVNILGSPIE